MKRTRPGYIFLITLVLLAGISFVITQMGLQSTTFTRFVRFDIDEQKARSLALAGVHLGMSQLADGMRSMQGAEQESIDTEKKLAARLLKTIVPRNGRWQTYHLKRDVDGINGTILICITCEESKIDLNALYDYKKKIFTREGEGEGDSKKYMQEVFARIGRVTKVQGLFESYAAWMQTQKAVLNDVTQLMLIPSFDAFTDKVFYKPADTNESGQEASYSLYLDDLFTVWSGKRTLEPWLLTESMCTLLGLTRSAEVQKYDKIMPQAEQDTFVWEKDWDTYLAPLYGKKYNDLPPGIRSSFATKFEPKRFSVLSCGKIGKVTQKVLAIVELRVMTTQNKQKRYSATIRSVYWL